jgi:hypothetical protein
MASASANADTESFQVVATVEGEIRELLRKQPGRRNSTTDTSSMPDVDAVFSLLGTVGESSVKEIDGVIAELQQLRDFLQSEGDRVRGEVAKYAEMNQGALACVEKFTSAIEPWKAPALLNES